MRNILLFILVLFCWTTALAQDEAAPGDTDGAEGVAADDTAETTEAEAVAEEAGLVFEGYTAEDFGFSIPIPAIGELQTPADYGWNQEPEVAFVWHGGAGSPVAMIELRADNIGTEVTPEQYEFFYDALVGEWEGQPKQFTVLRSRAEPYHFGEKDWLIIEVEDNSAAAENSSAATNGADAAQPATVYYTIFTTFHGEVFYTIGFYYLRPVSEAVQEMAVPMLRGFSVVGE